MPDKDPTKEEQDLKKGDDKASGDGQTEKKEGEGDGEETITLKKSELDKIKSDRDNYREIGLDKKAKDRELKLQKAKEGGEGGGDDKGGGESGGGTATIDEARATEIVQKGISSFEDRARKSSQQRASKIFLSTHKEYLDDALWNDLMSDFRTTGTEITIDDYVDRLEETLLVHKRRTGKLDEYLAAERERGKLEGRTEAEAGSGHRAGGVGDKSEGLPSGQLSEKGKEIARGVKLDPEKVEKVDPSKDNVIQV